MGEEAVQLPHKLVLNERKTLTMTGVTEVVSFDDTAVILKTGLGTLVVEGQQLQDLLAMTPHYYRIGKAGAKRLADAGVLTDRAGCVLNLYRPV